MKPLRLASLCVFFLAGLVIVSSPGFAAPSDAPGKTVRIGVLAKRGPDYCMKQWKPTADYLTTAIPETTFVIVPISFADIYAAVETGSIDFVLANPSIYVELEYRFGISRIATVKNWRLNGSYTRFSSVIFCQGTTPGIHRLKDLKNKRFMAVEKNSFGGWQMALREFAEKGIDPFRDFQSVEFAGTHDAVVYAVKNGRADAGCVRTDTLERMELEGSISISDFRVIHDHIDLDTELPFLHSTRAYPEWPLAKLDRTPDRLAETVALQLIGMPENAQAAVAASITGWTIPLNYQQVHECLRSIKAPPYDFRGKFTLTWLLKKYWLVALLLSALLVVLGVSLLVVAVLNRRIAETNTNLKKEITRRARITENMDLLNQMKEDLLKPIPFQDKLQRISRTAAILFRADFAGIWMLRTEGPCVGGCWCEHERNSMHCCSPSRKPCLRLAAAEGSQEAEHHYGTQDLHGDTEIGQIASGTLTGFVTNDLGHDTRIRRPDWAEPAGLVSFAGYPLLSSGGSIIGVFALFSRHAIAENDFEMIKDCVATASYVLDNAIIEQKLKVSEEYHRELFENSPVALYLQDFSGVEERVQYIRNQGVSDLKHYLESNDEEVDRLAGSVRIIQANAAAVDIYKAESADELVQCFDRLLKSDDRQHFIDQVADFTNGNDGYESEARNYDFNGNIMEIMLRKAAINRAVNGLSKILVSVVDVSDLHKAHREKRALEVQLQQRLKMETIGTLAGGIAHDFNNILFPIIGYSEMMLDDLKADDPLRGSISAIYNGAIRARDLVRQILTFSRQEKNEISFMKIQQILNEVVKMIRSTIPASIRLTCLIDGQCPSIKADPTQIHQLIMNLLTNAYQAIEDSEGEIQIRLSELNLNPSDLPHPDMIPGTYNWLVVSDTGTGMEEAIRERIFEPFFTTKETGKGTGMGLSVVHGIVKSMNGGIQVFSTPGKGTDVHVYFPVEERTSGYAAAELTGLLQGGSERILLVDDEQNILDMEQQMLQRLGYSVVARQGALNALETFRSDPDAIDLVITDLSMPEMPGNKLASELMKIRPDIPILLNTGFSDRLEPEQMQAMGIRGLLLKPVVMVDLAGTIRRVFDGAEN